MNNAVRRRLPAAPAPQTVKFTPCLPLDTIRPESNAAAWSAPRAGRLRVLSVILYEALARNWAIAAIVSTVLVLAVVPALVLFKYVRIALNIMRSEKPPLSRMPLDFEPLCGEPVRFAAFDGVRLNGMLVRAPRGIPRRGMVLFAHEFESNLRSCARYCRPLLDTGYDVFSFDFRGHGDSATDPEYTPRQWVSNRELDDMRGAIAWVESWLREQGYPPGMGVFGISRGACAAFLAAAENPNVVAIISDGAFSTDTTIEYFMKRWATIFASVRFVYENHPPEFWRFLRWLMMLFASRAFRARFPSVRKAIQRMAPRPALFIHGERDSYLPVEQGRLLYALAPQPKYFWVARGARHNQAAVLHPDTYARLTVGFCDRYLARATEPTAAPGQPAGPVSEPVQAPAEPLAPSIP